MYVPSICISHAQARERMPGIPYGCRVLMNLALAAESLGGASAPSRLVVLLHLNERQVEQVS